jgi:ABC-type multidrug transport system fused ATPase/permease subunit
MDAELEGRFIEGLRKMKRKCSMVIISHRLATIKEADLIIVLDKGKLVEQGTHRDLMRKNGHYARMFEEQALRAG